MLDHLLRLLGLAAVDSVNLLAFAVIAGLWLSAGGDRARFLPRAARFTGGAACGIVLLAAVTVWLVGSNQDVVRSLLDQVWVMAVLAVIGVVLIVLGVRQRVEPGPEAVEAPLARRALQRFGIAGTGVALGVVQSGTSVPFAAGVVLISFAETPWWAQVVQILFFAAVAIAPSVALIVGLGRIRSARTASAAARVDRLMSRGAVVGRYLTVVVGVAVVIFAAVRGAEISGLV